MSDPFKDAFEEQAALAGPTEADVMNEDGTPTEGAERLLKAIFEEIGPEEDKPCPGCGKVHGSSDHEREVFDLIDALPAEQRDMLILDALGKVSSLLEDVLSVRGVPPEAAAMVGVAKSTLHLAGYGHVSARQQFHPEWQSTGDLRVDSVWEAYAKVVTGGVLSEDDLPPEVIERAVAGTLTDEDRDVIRALIKERVGHDVPDDVRIDVVGAPQSKADSEPDGTGLYL